MVIAVAILVIGLGASTAGAWAAHLAVGTEGTAARSQAQAQSEAPLRTAAGPGFRGQPERVVHLGAPADEPAAGLVVHHARRRNALSRDDRLRVHAAGAGGRSGRLGATVLADPLNYGTLPRPTRWSRRHHTPSTACSATPPCWTSSGWGHPAHVRLLQPDHPGWAASPLPAILAEAQRAADRPVGGQLSVHQDPR